jgi:hypothetical protein
MQRWAPEPRRDYESRTASQSFDTKDEAVKWLLGLATALEAPSLPKTVRATRVPLRLGGAIPDTATIRS